jgi:8-oxo-dGTP diphosphatase
MSGPDDEPVVRVLAAVIQRQGRYLLCLRPPQKRHGGLWEFPGGKLEAGESLAQAARRELKEEVGVEVTEWGPPLFSHREAGSRYQIEFLPIEIIGEPRALEHDQVRWVSLEELKSLPLAPSDRAFAESYAFPATRS